MVWIQEHKLLIAWILFLILTYIGCYFIYKYMTDHSVVAKRIIRIRRQQREKVSCALSPDLEALRIPRLHIGLIEKF